MAGRPAMHQGEHLYMSEHVVVSPSSGIFSPRSLAPRTRNRAVARTGNDLEQSSAVEVGDLVGRVGVSEVRTRTQGQVIRWLAADGERVQDGQPLAWLAFAEGRHDGSRAQ